MGKSYLQRKVPYEKERNVGNAVKLGDSDTGHGAWEPSTDTCRSGFING